MKFVAGVLAHCSGEGLTLSIHPLRDALLGMIRLADATRHEQERTAGHLVFGERFRIHRYRKR